MLFDIGNLGLHMFFLFKRLVYVVFCVNKIVVHPCVDALFIFECLVYMCCCSQVGFRCPCFCSRNERLVFVFIHAQMFDFCLSHYHVCECSSPYHTFLCMRICCLLMFVCLCSVRSVFCCFSSVVIYVVMLLRFLFMPHRTYGFIGVCLVHARFWYGTWCCCFRFDVLVWCAWGVYGPYGGAAHMWFNCFVLWPPMGLVCLNLWFGVTDSLRRRVVGFLLVLSLKSSCGAWFAIWLSVVHPSNFRRLQLCNSRHFRGLEAQRRAS